jgi:hypothetical protein
MQARLTLQDSTCDIFCGLPDSETALVAAENGAPDSKSGHGNRVWVQGPTSALRARGEQQPQRSPRASSAPPHTRHSVDNRCLAVVDRRSRPCSRRRSDALVIFPIVEAGNGGIASQNSSARGRGGDKRGVHVPMIPSGLYSCGFRLALPFAPECQGCTVLSP